MKFTTPCFVRVKDGREELLTWLEHIGYDCSTARVDVEYYGKTEPVFMVVNGGDFRIQHNRPMLIEEHDCGTDIELFKALAAMNAENDREQWFIEEGRMFKCTSDKLHNYSYHVLYTRKATAEEIIEHFKL